MLAGDIIWAGVLAGVLAFVGLPETNKIFVSLTLGHPYLMSFLKFFLLATMGELLGRRIVSGCWSKPPGLLARMVIWGFIGISVMLTFEIFSEGVEAALAKGLIPGAGNRLLTAFYTSLVCNLCFAPVFMIFHRFSDTSIEVLYATGKRPSLGEIISLIDWHNMVCFVLLTTIPGFWIPAHTITFLLPPEYRMIFAAILSIVIGTILSYASRKGKAAAGPPASGGVCR
ncbi:Mpv17/PMP22 family protein [Moorellaceae bacterium AZ2]